MPRSGRLLFGAAALYAAAWVAYVAKSAAGIDLVAYSAPIIGGHHGWMFPGSDGVIGWLRR